MRRLVVEELRVVRGKLANLICHLLDQFRVMVLQQAQVAVHGRHWSRKVQIKPKFDQNLRLQVYELLLADHLPLFVSQEAGHHFVARSQLLLHFGGYDERSGRQQADVLTRKIPMTDVLKVAVEDVDCREKRLGIVLLLRVQAEDLLYRVAAVRRAHDERLRLFLRPLGDEEFLPGRVELGVHIITSDQGLLLLPDSEITGLSEFGRVLEAAIYGNDSVPVD